MYIDPSGHVVTQWDYDHCTPGEIVQLKIATNMYEFASSNGDTAGMQHAHSLARKIRENYLQSYEALGLDGIVRIYLSQADIDAGTRIHTAADGSQYLDVTIPIKTAVVSAEALFRENKYNLSWFKDQVNHNAPWDIKRKNRWLDTIGTTYPGIYSKKVIFEGGFTTPEELGNITYGYLGTASKISEFVLIVGGNYAAGGIWGIFTGADSEKDKEAIRRGIQWYWRGHIK